MRLLDGSGMSGDIHVPFCERLRVRLPWSTHLTKLEDPFKWTCFHLYVILDIFNR